MIDVDVRLYGAFREYSQEKVLRFQLEPGSSLEDLRGTLAQHLEVLQPAAATRELVAKSAFASDHDILDENHRLLQSQVLSIIPPVCGG